MMPGMNGIEFAIEAGRVCPQTKILLVSGNAATQEIYETACLRGRTFPLMAKPVPPQELLGAVEAILKDVG
jgi:CheY-like chemotaxis protein